MKPSMFENNHINYLIGADLVYIHKIFKERIIGNDLKNNLLKDDKKIYAKKDAERYILAEIKHMLDKVRLIYQKGGGKAAKKIKKHLHNIKDIEVISLEEFIENYEHDIISR